jgi:threonine synthase
MTGAGSGIFRHVEHLPVQDVANAISLGEGDTPLIDLIGAVGACPAERVRMKCEFTNPTGSFKDRIAAVAVTVARERGLRGLVGTSSGNGGAAIAAYAARGSLPLTLFILPGTPAPKLRQITCHGPRVVPLAGLGEDPQVTATAVHRVIALADERRLYPFVTARSFSPEAMEGAKTIAYELAEDAPDATAVYVPVGGGGLLSAIWRGYRDIRASLPHVPRIVAVQPSGCPTVRAALSGEPAVDVARTRISGLQVATLLDAEDVVAALAESGGHLVEVDDRAVWDAQRQLALHDGVLVEPAGATAFAGLLTDVRSGRLEKSDNVVVVGTGAGFKDPVALRRLAPTKPRRTISIDEIDSAFEK